MNNFKNKYQNQTAFILIQAVVFGSIAVVMIGGLILWAATNIKLARKTVNREQAFQIAEAGIDYYKWHLAHAPLDYQDGTGQPGPYVHDYYDYSGYKIGEFTLNITPPAAGSTLVTINSTGTVDADPSVVRTIESKVFYTSFAKFAFVSNSEMRFGAGTEVFGPIHSNGGIRFDGYAHNLVSSAVGTYDDPDHNESGDDSLEFGVHTHVNNPSTTPPTNDNFRPLEGPPSEWQKRDDVFGAGRQTLVPAVDFVGIASKLTDIKDAAIADGKYYAGSGALGYQIVLKDNDKYNIYRVNSLMAAPTRCTNTQNQSGWGTWSINSTSTISGGTNVNFPANGIIFAQDNIWVEGKINTARLTIASGKFPEVPSTNTSITINRDLLYTNYDGQDAIGLIAQKDINVGLNSTTTLRIDAALVAQSGRVGRYYYPPNANWPSNGGNAQCSPYHLRNSITLYGMLGSYGRYGFAYTDGTGYTNRTIIYDANLLYAPPPLFPIAYDQYQSFSWEEVE
jgi:hypothetical protein